VTTRATAPAPRPLQPQPEASDPRSAGTPSWLVLLLGCAVLAAISLFVLPRTVAYDPYSWLNWGREITHLHLDTRNAATAVKPLPIFVDTLLAPTGSLAPLLWLLIARAATLLALALAFRLGCRLGGWGAGLLAAIGLAVSDQFLGYLLMQGMSEPMAAAAVLAAVDNHMQARRRWAFACLIAAGLLRPEAWPFLIVYSFWMAYLRLNWERVLGVLVAGATVLVWFVIDWFGAREFFRSAGAASKQSQGGPLLSREPGLATIRETWHLVSGPIIVLFLLGFATAVVMWWRAGRRAAPSPSVWLGLGAIGWLAVDAVLAQGRFATGAERYLLPGVALACVVAGVFVADVVRAIVRVRPGSRASLAAGAVVCLAVVGFLAPRAVTTGRQINSGIKLGRVAVKLAANLPHAIARGGGRDAVIDCGQVSTQSFEVPIVAWQLHIPVGEVINVPGVPGVVFQSAGQPAIPSYLGDSLRNRGTVGSGAARWTVLTKCQG
jgi:hypothetical protein